VPPSFTSSLSPSFAPSNTFSPSGKYICENGFYCTTTPLAPCVPGTTCTRLTSGSSSVNQCILDSAQDLTSNCTAKSASCQSNSICCSKAYTCVMSASTGTKLCIPIGSPSCVSQGTNLDAPPLGTLKYPTRRPSNRQPTTTPIF
jgi:hypothetical protein